MNTIGVNYLFNKKNTLLLTKYSTVKFLPLTFTKELEDKFYVGLDSKDTYFLVDKENCKLVKLCNGKRTIEQAACIYCEYNNIDYRNISTYIVKLIDTIKDFYDYEFIESIDNIQLSCKDTLLKKRICKQTIFKNIFSLKLYFVISIISFFSIGLIFNKPELFPKASDIVWNESIGISLLTHFLFSTIIIILHETTHYISSKSRGLESEIRLSNRLVYVVAETEIKNIYKLNIINRAVIYLSGIAFEAILMALFIILLWLDIDNKIFMFKDIHLLIKQFILILFRSIIWEFYFYMETDIYALVSDILGSSNLLLYTKTYIKFLFFSIIFKLTGLFKIKINQYYNDLDYEDFYFIKKYINYYTLFFIIGFIITIYLFFTFDLPITIKLIGQGIGMMNIGSYDKNASMFIEGGIVLVLQLFYLILLVIVLFKSNLSKTSKAVSNLKFSEIHKIEVQY